ncbi:two-component sensor histidine kinase [Prescottella equi]|uniref:sensor histidine kinase n=1 Tax=Rhodococcus hoagii TaxID=43767 RepID=UPI000A115309|nr:histidine kinase [Prescottella equi]ORL30568.1 two-component sensor histidine kinase [Prescottella equi]ORL86208.1 two-component sensor histidine kinase [Prescottella equi]ORM13106.1 two-component sensor histidine kinase [Prescottella equi]
MVERIAGVGAPVAAAAVAVTCWTLVVLSLVTFLVADPGIDSNQLFFLVDVVGSAVYGTVAGVVLARRVHPVPIILGAAAIGIGLAALGYAYSQWAAVRPDLPWVDVLSPLQNTAWIPGTLALFLVIPWLVRDHRLDDAARVGLVAGTLVTAWFFLARTFTDVSEVPLLAPVVAVGFVAAADVARRWRSGPVDERVGLGWLALGTALMALSFVPLMLPATVPGLWMITPVAHLVVQPFFLGAIFVSILRQRMWGLDLAVSRAVLAGSLTALLIGLYVVVATVLAGLLPDGGSTGAQFVAAAVVAVAVQPSRMWLQHRVHRLVYGSGSEPGHAVRELGRHFGSAESPTELLEGLAAGVGLGLRLESVTVHRADGAESVCWGRATGPAETVDLVHRGARVGSLAVTAPPGESLGLRSRKSLSELASVVTAGLVVVQSAEDLATARRRLASVRAEERRVIRRELHDGLGPSLAGIRLGLQGVRNLLVADPQAAAKLLDSLQEQLDHQVDGVRSLSRNLFPPVLDELGLGAALEELATGYARSGFDLDVVADVPADIGGQAGAAAYGIAIEAVTNARRHSGASGCRVEASCGTDGAGLPVLTLVVRDAGRGCDPSAPAGIGTRSMRERADELGGTVTIETGCPRGTVVTARLPLVAS